MTGDWCWGYVDDDLYEGPFGSRAEALADARTRARPGTKNVHVGILRVCIPSRFIPKDTMDDLLVTMVNDADDHGIRNVEFKPVAGARAALMLLLKMWADKYLVDPSPSSRLVKYSYVRLWPDGRPQPETKQP